MLVRNNHGGCTAPGGYEWSEPGSVVEVPDWLGNDLIRIGGDFEEVAATAATDEGPAVDLDGDGVPDGTANQVLEWVGSDRERAAAALAAEHAKGDAARSSLVAKLEKLTASKLPE